MRYYLRSTLHAGLRPMSMTSYQAGHTDKSSNHAGLPAPGRCVWCMGLGCLKDKQMLQGDTAFAPHHRAIGTIASRASHHDAHASKVHSFCTQLHPCCLDVPRTTGVQKSQASRSQFLSGHCVRR